ncbi:sugar ABC transporter ATP-binding protein [Nocardia sp. alder85J]|uniref:sugar ABC transporter ATP-binding protein n=1 Tax=Nocardia sp. alder85J TaxID=2862949 RepID=UPI001CD1C253|nr:sugar ABC transporter ATP-binding protein [Nocardia sp. alder85J]MCX4098846.1 sugar ABC transporter ATP-binding protein [Nocardia sp. alder85J]
MTGTDRAAVALREVGMAFGGKPVLADVSLDVSAGAVTALLGANGAGKSTLIKVLSGVYPEHTGQVSIDGEPVDLRSPAAARKLGVQTVHQHIADGVVPGLSVAENLVFEQIAAGRGNPWLDTRRVLRRAREIAAVLDLGWDERTLRRDVAELGISDQQLLLLARALSTRPRLLILDEPTAALSAAEARRLFAIVDRMRAEGIAVLYVSHRLAELDALADRLVVLRDGRLIAEQPRPFDWDRALRAMLATRATADPERGITVATSAGGPAAESFAAEIVTEPEGLPDSVPDAVVATADARPNAGARTLRTFAEPTDAEAEDEAAQVVSRLAEVVRPKSAGPGGGPVVVSLRGVPLLRGRAPQDLDIRGGEVTGVVGLLGAGKTELARGLFGADPFGAGTLELAGKRYRPRHPADAIARGVHLVPEDRHVDALIPDWSIAENLSLPFLRSLSEVLGVIRRGRERELGSRTIERLGIVARGEASLVEELSGGNQQKVVVGRWLAHPPRVLILDEPFRGVDIGARRDIGRQARQLAADGAAVLLLSADVDEVLEVADRVIVLADGEIRSDGYDIAGEQVIAALAGSAV